MIENITDKITSFLKNKGSVVIAIDGMSGSGKTTYARELSKKFAARLIHMDDFFLPESLRNKDRLQEVGGNVHYERIKEEVIDRLKQDIEYSPFDCKTMSFLETIKLPYNVVTIIEGAYSLHPKFNKYYDISIYMGIDEELQKKRLIKRGGTKYYQNFKNKWIPLENQYLSIFRISEKTDYRIEIKEKKITRD